MTFWNLSVFDLDAPALLTGADAGSSRKFTYRQVAAAADSFWQMLGVRDQKRLGVILCRNTAKVFCAYLAALRGGDAVMLLNDQTDPVLLQNILDAYCPDWIYRPESDRLLDGYRVDPPHDGWQILRWQAAQATNIHPDLAVLLSTSGTSGSSKMVRLSHNNIDANARSVVDYLAIGVGDRAVTTLPFSYSYGMSVVNSHFCAGATLVLTEAGLLSREFWDVFAYHGVTSLAGVPYTYQMLHRLNPRKLSLGSLRTLTQAGGRLSQALTDYFRVLSEENGWRFFVMYGQTEAAPRISYVPPHMLVAKSGSIGIPIPGGQLSLSEDGELIYVGANVMMGYALSRADLAQGDELCGRLATGDLSTVDADGFYFLHGRLNRFIKIHGNRVNLDDIEQRLEADLRRPLAVVGQDDKLFIFLEGEADFGMAKDLLSKYYHLHPSTFRLQKIEAIPHTASGKKNYAGLPT